MPIRSASQGEVPRLLHGVASLLRRVARHFRGLTWSMLGAFWLIIVVNQLTTIVIWITGGNELWKALEVTVKRIVLNGLVWLPTLLCVIVALNLKLKSASRRVLALACAILIGTVAQLPIDRWLQGLLFGDDVFVNQHIAESTWKSVTARLGGWLTGVAVAVVAVALLYFARRDSEAMARLRQEELDRIGLGRQMSEARLQVLQAQIEPHFLFNTLANVRRLYEVDPPSGKSMLRHLRGYLGAALPDMRASQSTLGRELGLTVAYLNVQKIRMGARLSFDIDVPEPLKALPFPSMMLVTLVENAIKHGLAPLPEGGSIRLLARERARVLQVQVRDDGAGFRSTSGAGVGLTNIRMRLATLHGSAGRLVLEQNATRGVTATLDLPIEASAAAIVMT